MVRWDDSLYGPSRWIQNQDFLTWKFMGEKLGITLAPPYNMQGEEHGAVTRVVKLWGRFYTCNMQGRVSYVDQIRLINFLRQAEADSENEEHLLFLSSTSHAHWLVRLHAGAKGGGPILGGAATTPGAHGVHPRTSESDVHGRAKLMWGTGSRCCGAADPLRVCGGVIWGGFMVRRSRCGAIGRCYGCRRRAAGTQRRRPGMVW